MQKYVDLVIILATSLYVCQAPLIFRMIARRENLEISGNLIAVGKMSGNLLKIRDMSGNCQGKNLVRENVSLNVSGL